MPESNDLLYDVGLTVAAVSLGMTAIGAIPVAIGFLMGGVGGAADAYYMVISIVFQPPYVVATVVAVVFIAAEFMPIKRATSIGILLTTGITGLLVEFSPGVTLLFVVIPGLIGIGMRSVAFRARDRLSGGYTPPFGDVNYREKLGDIIATQPTKEVQTDGSGAYEAFTCFEHGRDAMSEDEALDHFMAKHDMTEEEVREQMSDLRSTFE